MLIKATDPREAALGILRRDLTGDARGALAYLLNNALCPLVCDLSFDDAALNLGYVRDAVMRLRAMVLEIVSG